MIGQPSTLLATPGRQRTLLAAAASVVILAYLFSMFLATEGHFVAQVTDLYLICQYARAAAEGHPFHYAAGEPASTGATSLLHTAILAAAHRVGFRGEALIAFAIFLGAALYAGAVLLARRIGARLAGPRAGLLAGLLVALGGPVVWAFLYGSDIALFMLLALWLLEALLVAWPERTPKPLVLPGILLALARPEGLLIVAAVAAFWEWGPGRGQAARARLSTWVPVLTGLAVLLVYRMATGTWIGTSIRDKSLFDNYGLTEGLALVSEYLTDVVRGLLLGFYPSQAAVGLSRGWASFYFAPLALVFILLSALHAPPRLLAPVRLWLGIVCALFVLVAPNMYLGSHFNRYLLWAFPTLHVLAAAGLAAACSRMEGPAHGSLFRVLSLVFVALAALSTLRFAVMYGDLAGEVYRRDLAAARFVMARLPPGVRIANLATSVEYLTGHHNVNLHGITSPAFFGTRPAEREAGVLESLGRLKAAERPELLMATLSSLDSYPTMREIIEPEPLFRTTSLTDEIVIHRLRYDLIGRGQHLFLPGTRMALEGLREVDRLNVCDPLDEQAHRYSFHSTLGHLRLNGTARIAAYPGGERVMDGGRAILGRERFLVRTEPGQDLVVVLRTAADTAANVFRAAGNHQVGIELAKAVVVLRANDEVAAQASFSPRPGWDEVVIRVNRGVIRSRETTLELSGRYAAFQYWFFQ